MVRMTTTTTPPPIPPLQHPRVSGFSLSNDVRDAAADHRYVVVDLRLETITTTELTTTKNSSVKVKGHE